MATIVLVPGGWSGGWIWKPVTALLQKAGHVTYAPTPTGVGERIHLARAEISLATHVQDIVNVLTYEDLHDVVLAGWSYGGMLITGAVEQVPERIGHLVYIDAQFPLDGQSSDDVDNEVSEAGEDGWSIAAPPEDVFGNTDYTGAYIPDPNRRQWMASRLVAQPIKTFTNPLHRTNLAAGKIRRTHLTYTVGKSDERLAQIRERLNQEPGGAYREYALNHMSIVGAPDLVAQSILDAL